MNKSLDTLTNQYDHIPNSSMTLTNEYKFKSYSLKKDGGVFVK